MSAAYDANPTPLKLDNLRADLRRWGWLRSLLLRIVSRPRTHAGIHIYRIGLRPLVKAALRLDGICVRIARPEELLTAANDPELDMRPDFVRSALARGDFAIGAFRRRSPRRLCLAHVHRGARCRWPVGQSRAPVPLPLQRVYSALPSREAHPGCHSGLSDRCFLEQGYTSEVGIVDIANFASLSNGKRLGRRKAGYAGYVKWFGCCLPFRTPGAKKIGFEFFKPPAVVDDESAAPALNATPSL